MREVVVPAEGDQGGARPGMLGWCVFRSLGSKESMGKLMVIISGNVILMINIGCSIPVGCIQIIPWDFRQGFGSVLE